MGVRINGKGIILLRIVYLADSGPMNGLLLRMSVGSLAFPVGNHRNFSNIFRS